MDLSVHFAVSACIAAVLYPFFGWASLFVIVGGFLIDGDHYLWTIVAKKNWSMKYSYDYYKRCMHKNDYILHPLHTVEFISVVIFLAMQYTFAALFAVGYFLHLIMDRIYSLQFSQEHNRQFCFFWFNDQKGQRSFSLIYWLFVELKIVRLWRFGAVDEDIKSTHCELNSPMIAKLSNYPPVLSEMEKSVG